MKSKFILYLIMSILAVNCSEKSVKEINKEDPKPPVVTQPEDPESYTPTNGNSIDKDIKINPTSVTSSEHQNGTDIDKTIDGDKGTIYHSRWGNNTEYPVELTYNFGASADKINYFVLYPRSDSENGVILEYTIYIKYETGGDFVKFKEIVYSNGKTPKIVNFPEALTNPSAIKLSITKGINDFVSLAEIEFYKENATIEESLTVFQDKACTQLKAGTTREDIEAIDNEFIKNMALALFNDVYDDFRIGTFKSYPDPEIMSDKNKTGTYGIYDNVTGIYVKWGTEMVVFMDDFNGEIALRIVNHNQGFGGQDFVLRPGVNRFTANTEGLAYLIYQNSNEYEVKANIATGKINGYFDVSKHRAEDWQTLIDNAEYTYFDVLGNYAHLTFTTQDFRQHTPDITKLIELYDNIVDTEQDFLGLYKYNRANKSRMYFRTNTHQDMYMYATTNRTEYHKSTMPDLCNPATLKASPWGPAHEVGHINQTRPGLRWLGMTEVTNNIYSLYVQTQWGNGARIDEENLGEYNNRYEKAFTELLAPKLAHAEHGDVFCKLIPFWQLQLYFANVLGKTDFYKDVHEAVRESEDKASPGASQVEFAKICSDIAQTDLTDFFIAWGFLKPVNIQIDDYGVGVVNVSQAMVDDAIDYIKSKGYAQPDAKFEYLHDQVVSVFKNKAAVVKGTASVTNNNVTISGTQNAIVYQQERNGEVIYISPKSTFSVPSFQSTDKIYAVAYDGQRTEIPMK